MNSLIRHKRILIIFLFSLVIATVLAQNTSVKFGLLKYSGGGDWYANPTSLKNLIKFCNTNLGTNIAPEAVEIEVGNKDIFNLPFIHMTGHGNVIFSDNDRENLRNYLISGGFLHIDDNYGMDEFVRREMKKVFPEAVFVELPANHPIYRQKYDFPNGLPKIHEHDAKSPQGFGIFYEGRLVCYYTYETDLGDGWEDQAVHKDSDETRTKALKMGANIISYVFGF
ncbi:MAG: hypothetical protein A2275_08700 [Bacteroidetes bacterium RIFOXYA12_FULL_35_11]|nr:MAG: hypothetical protein A2X01_16820 [Bacteroidetes bacterium GWF2_35_48]OFY82881.1 MAG: hypothetical protein A2275_08700 [Bacteroidetes bacterium RIFOXYA12_FULL_35_11]OFY95066.1 MAG: hypothetical protein A2491_16355 [Bacteroidetes bacterium RIFOXYC12_FULL_35_7]HBX53575.1 hypothetical protein [Bacteroidales bacterium]